MYGRVSLLDIKKREKQYEELFKLLDIIEKASPEQKEVYDAIYKKKLDLLTKEFDLWIGRTSAELNKRIEEHLKRKENAQ
jgi:t-SNARE complex subunit (syntaxin)